MIVGKTRSLPLSGVPERGFTHVVSALPANIKLKGLRGASTLAYYEPL